MITFGTLLLVLLGEAAMLYHHRQEMRRINDAFSGLASRRSCPHCPHCQNPYR